MGLLFSFFYSLDIEFGLYVSCVADASAYDEAFGIEDFDKRITVMIRFNDPVAGCIFSYNFFHDLYIGDVILRRLKFVTVPFELINDVPVKHIVLLS